MVMTHTGTMDEPLGRTPSPPFPVFESKLTPPLVRQPMVPRTGLLRRLEASTGVPVVAISAPSGYGKTTLLAQWAARGWPRTTRSARSESACICRHIPSRRRRSIYRKLGVSSRSQAIQHAQDLGLLLR
jgi:ATP/maltotriose-dependent transcriptional regulator MalT